MSTFDDARATWDLLDETERKALAYISGPNGVTGPQGLGLHLGCSWQKASRVARSLKAFGLVRVISMPKQTSYEISGQGKTCLAASRPVTDLEGL